MNASCGFAPALSSRVRSGWRRRVCAVWVAFFGVAIAEGAYAQNVWTGADPGSDSGCEIDIFTVPNGATYVQVTAIGQAGQRGSANAGGDGGIVTVVAAVTPGQKLYAAPTPSMFTFSSPPPAFTTSGGRGGVGSFVATSDPSASCAAHHPPSAASLLVVAAGGGGGGGGALSSGTSGSGGAAGRPGESGDNNDAVDGGGGDPGSQTGGGTGGAGGSSYTLMDGYEGGPGDYFAGGSQGPDWDYPLLDAGGGGGGAGYYGGGGGGGNALSGAPGGGGGGSNYVAPSIPTSPPNPQITGTVENGSTTRKALVEITPIFLTTTTITSSPNPSAYGQSVTITANVTSSAGGYPSGGNVDITDGFTTIATVALANGVATYTTSAFTQGQHPLQALYSGYSSDSEIDRPSYSVGQNVGGIVTPYTQVVGAPLALPTISLNPSDQSTTYGQTVEWQVAGNGNPSPTIQWQVSTDGGVNYSNLAGQTSQYLILTAQVTWNGNRYRALFSNAAGTVATSAAVLTVQPAGLQVVANNQTMSFGGSEPPLTVSYYGFVNGENASVLGGSLTCTTTPATITATTPLGDYPINCSGLSSSNYTIYYVAGTLHIVTPSPNISASPMPAHSYLGSTFAISAIKGASSNPIVFSVDPSTADNACTVSAVGVVSFVHTNYYSGAALCVIDLNQAGDGTYPASAQVQLSGYANYLAPGVSLEPTPSLVELAAGGATTLTFNDVGAPPPTVQWYYVVHGQSLTPILIPGATSTTLTLSNVTTNQDGAYYYARLSNNPGQVLYATNTDISTTTVTLKVDGAPFIYTQPQNVEVDAGGSYNLASAASGSPAATPQWQISTDGGATWTNSSHPGATTDGMSFSSAVSGDDGTLYRVIYANTYGSTISDAAVIHVDYQNITGNPGDLTRASGQSASFTASFAGYPAATVQWQSAPPGTTTFTDIPGALSPTLTIAKVDPSQSGMRYRAVFTQTGAVDGTIVTPSSYATLTVTLASPTFAATAGAGGTFGKNVTDGAVLAAGDSPSGTITFKLFDVGDSTCSSASLFTSTVAVSGNDNYGSASFQPATVGTYYWTASYSGDARNNAASAPCASTGQSVTITQASQAIVFGALPQVVVAGTGNVTATGGGSNNTVTFSTNTPTICSVTSAGLVTGILAGSCKIDAAQAGNSNYLSATASTTLPIGKANQTITFSAQSPSSRTFAPNGTFAINPLATSAAPNSGNVIVYSSQTTGVCTVSGTTVTMISAGNCKIAADQAGDSDYHAATTTTQNVAIGKANQTITFSAQSPSSHAFAPNGTFAINPLATSTSGLTPTYSSQTAGICIVNGTTVTMVSTGTCTIAADQAGNSNYNAATTVTQNVAITSPKLVLTLVDDGDGYVQYSKPPVYTATLENQGSAAASNIMVNFGLSAGLDAFNEQWTCNVVTGSVVCPTSSASMTVAAMPAGSMLQWTLTVPLVPSTTETTVRVDLSATNATSVSDTDVLVIFSGDFDQ